MAIVMPQKIVLRSTTSMSLNERFSSIVQAPRAAPVQQVRLRMASLNQASARTNREAIQMANRSLTSGGGDQNTTNVRERLGPVSALARLGPGRDRGRIFRGGYMRGRGGAPSFRGRGGTYSVSYSRGAANQYAFPRGAYRGRPFQGFRGRGMVPFIPTFAARGRGGFSERRFWGGSLRGRGGSFRGDGRGRGIGQASGFRGQGSGFRGRGRGGRGRGLNGMSPMSREQLDSQLDEYMAKTPGRLNADLDHYMADENY